MQKQKKQMIVLIVLLLLFVAAFFALKAWNKDEAEKEAAEAEADKIYVTDFNSEDVTAFSYQTSDETLRFVKEDTWKYENDTSLELDETAITAMLNAAAQLEAEKAVESEENLSAYGFDSPTNVLTFTTKDGTTTLTIGMKNDIMGQYYLTKNEGDTLYLVNESVPSAFEKTLEDLEKSEEESETEESQTAE